MFRFVVILAVVGSACAGPIEGRIVGGRDTFIEEVPWQVSVMLSGDHTCGGSIINNRTILTAAHCLDYSTPDEIEVRVGSSFRNWAGIVYKVEDLVSHRLYTPVTVSYDVGIIRTEKEIRFGPAVQPISLPERMRPLPVWQAATISGYGMISPYGTMPYMLQSAEVPVTDEDTCRAAYESQITESMFCAGYPEGGRDACQLDSGGPLVVDNVLVGVVSWGDECGKPDKPGVYTNVAFVRDWIDATISNY